MKKYLAIILACLMLVSLFAGCTPKEPTGEAGDDTEAGESGNPVIKIGVFEPASGDNGAGGKQETLGMQYANYVQPTVEINGTTYDVELVFADNESADDKGPIAANSLVSAGVSVVLGSYGSSVSITGSPVFEKNGIPAIGVTCTNPQVTAGNKHYFRICFLDPFQGPILANYAYGNLGVKKAYCLSKLGDDYSGGLVNYFAEEFEKLGGEVIKETFPVGNSDFASYVASAKANDCGVFFSPISIEAAQLIIEQADTQELGMPILAGDTWDSNVILDAVKDRNVEVTVTTFYAEGADAEFEAGCKKWINDDPVNLKNNNDNDIIAAVTAMGYDAYFFALEAMKNASSIEPADVMEALWATEIDGVSGHIALDPENGDAIINTAYVKKADTETGLWKGLPSITID